jgi:putative DNA primase/helicase
VAAFAVVASAALANARDLLSVWLPGGKVRGHEYVCGSIQGGPGDSFSVNITTGAWREHAGGVPAGGDLVSLYAEIHRIDNQGTACNDLARELGIVNGRDYEVPAIVAREESAAATMHDFPSDRPPLETFRHSRFGMPTATWLYRSAAGVPRGAIARYDRDDGKDIVPWIFDGTHYRARAFDKPRMLYGLDHLALNPQARVLLVEGEKAALAAQEAFPRRPCMTWPGGTGGWKHADWAPLAGLQVTLWPDNDDPGKQAAAGIAALLLKLKCRIWIVDPNGMPESWDIADHDGPPAALLEYAKSHTREVTSPKLLEKAPPVARVKELPPPGAQTIEGNPEAGSTVVLWAEWGLALKAEGRRPYLDSNNIRKSVTALKVECFYDTFASRIMWDGKEFDDQTLSKLHDYLQGTAGMRDLRLQTVRDGVRAYAFLHPRNPPVEWFDSIKWDGVHRLGLLMAQGFGAKPGEYMAAVSRNFLTGVVARVMRPGCKADCMPIFEGAQGAGKSRALKALGGEYFAEVNESIANKDFLLSFTGKMLVELGELNSLHGQNVKRIKGILSTPTDRYRKPYGELATDNPRQCVFAGTTNELDWNVDETGARRFWPVKCGKISITWIEQNREQLFAEAVARFKAGKDWWSLPETYAREQRDDRRPSDPWDDRIAAYCADLTTVFVPDVATDCLQMRAAEISTPVAKRIANILLYLNYEPRRVRIGPESRRARAWIKRGLSDPDPDA